VKNLNFGNVGMGLKMFKVVLFKFLRHLCQGSIINRSSTTPRALNKNVSFGTLLMTMNVFKERLKAQGSQ